MRSINSSGNVIVGETRRGEAISKFKSAGGKIVRVLNSGVYRQASAAAGKKLREITGSALGGRTPAMGEMSEKHGQISGRPIDAMGVRRR